MSRLRNPFFAPLAGFAVSFAAGAEGAWTTGVLPSAQRTLSDGIVTIVYDDDAEHPGGIVLARVALHPEGDWTLDSMPDIEKETGLRPTAIGGGFAGRQGGLRSFAIPQTVRSIGNAAFSMCENATNTLALPAGLETIGRSAFYCDKGLSGDLTIPAGIERIEFETFYGCSGLKSLSFAPGSQLRTIGPISFKRCSGIEGTVDFSPCAELERIDPEAFLDNIPGPADCTPDRVVFGEDYRRRVAESLAAADEREGYRRASTDWFAGSFGIGVHWTTWSADGEGRGKGEDFEKAVDAFDVPRFVAQVKKAGAKHVIFTSSWAEQHPPAPCPALDRILPGRTTRRNLLREIADSLAAEGVRTILYYNHGCNGEDKEWMDAVGYAPESLDRFAANIVSIVGDLSVSCGPNVAGWWFDSPAAVSSAGPHKTAKFPLGDWRFPFRELVLAAKAGNPDAIVSVNSQGGTFLYTTCQEYFGGEEMHTFPLCGRFNARGMQMHVWSTMDNRNWVKTAPFFAALRFDDETLSRIVRERTADGCAVTFNVDIDRTGLLNPAAIEQLARIGAASNRFERGR